MACGLPMMPQIWSDAIAPPDYRLAGAHCQNFSQQGIAFATGLDRRSCISSAASGFHTSITSPDFGRSACRRENICADNGKTRPRCAQPVPTCNGLLWLIKFVQTLSERGHILQICAVCKGPTSNAKPQCRNLRCVPCQLRSASPSRPLSLLPPLLSFDYRNSAKEERDGQLPKKTRWHGQKKMTKKGAEQPERRLPLRRDRSANSHLAARSMHPMACRPCFLRDAIDAVETWGRREARSFRSKIPLHGRLPTSFPAPDIGPAYRRQYFMPDPALPMAHRRCRIPHAMVIPSARRAATISANRRISVAYADNRRRLSL